MVNKIDLDLRGRFVKDYNLPIQVLVSPYFEYFLDLYQEDYGSKSKWDKLQKEIAIIENNAKKSISRFDTGQTYKLNFDSLTIKNRSIR